MADGIPCGMCGWQEAEHNEPRRVAALIADPSKPLKGYVYSLDDCLLKRGFVVPARFKEKQQNPDR